MRTIDDALEIVLRETPAPTVVEVSGVLPAVGRVLAEKVVTEQADPPFDRSTMDGFALRAADATEPGAALRIVGESAAGTPFDGEVGPGCATRIFTGAVLPAGADSVLMVEKTEESDGVVRLAEAVRPGLNVTRAGEYLAAGDTVLPAGTPISAAHVGVLLAVGAVRVSVFRRPRVAILATGSELVDPTEVPGPGCIRESNAGALAALVRQAGGEATILERVPDDRTAIAAAAERGLDHDLFLLTGGSSVGDYDFTPDVLRELGVELHFDRVAVKPGKPTIFGTRGRRVVFGLPGNPVSAFVAFHLFVRPSIQRLLGAPTPGPRWLGATLREEVKQNRAREQVLPARVVVEAGRITTDFRGWHGSGDTTSLRNADALVRLDRGEGSVEAGSQVLITPIDGGRAGDVSMGWHDGPDRGAIRSSDGSDEPAAG